ncbi:MAG: hypothetical protein P8178_16745, partial [Candidatus Thiodiazotropha sp.]
MWRHRAWRGRARRCRTWYSSTAPCASVGSAQADSGRSILLISDGDFDEPGLVNAVRDLKRQGITLDTLGVGTVGGGPVPVQADQGDLMRDRKGTIIESRLDEHLLKQLAEAGGGIYQRADFRDQDSRNILKQAAGKTGKPTPTQQKTRVWNERFYW